MALKVLLADDNITAQKMGCKILTDAGYTVVAVSNGAAAMKKIVAEKPELIILDVYMPGYTGLEVCEKVKNAPETAHVPVVLTVTNMEPFSAEDGDRVKADGVLIKPFEATDLLAVVRKFEEKMQPPEAEKTVKMAAVQEFEDESYAEWKAEAAPEDEAKPAEMSHEMASSPAMGIEGLTPGASAPAFAVEAASAPFTMDAQPLAEQGTAPAFDLNAPAPAFELEHAVAAGETAPVMAAPAELEFTSAAQTGAVEVAPAAELEITAQEAAAEAPIEQDAALVTDPTDITQFATKFGQEHPEDIPVGIAMEQPLDEAEVVLELPEPVVEPVPPEPRSPHWGDEDVRQALGFSGGAVAAAPAREAAPEAEVGVDTQPLEMALEQEAAPTMEAAPEPEPAPAAEPPDVTQQLVAQFAAELEAAQREAPPEPDPAPQPEMEPPAAAATAVGAADEQHVAAAVSRVLERYKGELIAAIVRELKS